MLHDTRGLQLGGRRGRRHHADLRRADEEPESLVSIEHAGHCAWFGGDMEELIDKPRDVGRTGICEIEIAQLFDLGLKHHGVTTLFDIRGQAARSSSSPNPGPNQKTSPPEWTAKATM